MYIERDIEKEIRKYLDKPEILAVIGPRQSGKTTLIRKIHKELKKSVFVDFEDRDALGLFNVDIKSFYEYYAKNADYLFIDEFQYATEGGKKLKFLYDNYSVKIIISGSSAPDLTHQAIKYLVGRLFVFHLFPFSFQEYLSYVDNNIFKNFYIPVKQQLDLYYSGKNKKVAPLPGMILDKLYKYYQQYAIFGGYPRVVLSDDPEEKVTVLKNIYNTYFLREIIDIIGLSTESEFRRLLKALAFQVGSVAVYNELSQISSLNYKSLLKHLNILEKTFVIKQVLPYYTNKRVEISKSPKVYFHDNGLRNAVINDFKPFDQRSDRGDLNENFAASQLIKNEKEIKYWRTKSNAEVDFVVEQGSEIVGIEIKSSLKAKKTGKAVYSFKSKYHPSNIIIASEKYFALDEENNIIFLPLFFV